MKYVYAALIGTAIVATSALPAFALSLGELTGEWNNIATGEDIIIKADQDVLDTRLGEGRIGSTITNAANFVIVYQGGTTCYYYITLLKGGNSLNVAVRSSKQSSLCLGGVFAKAQ